MTETRLDRVRDGKLVEHTGDRDQLGLMQQLGAIPRGPLTAASRRGHAVGVDVTHAQSAVRSEPPRLTAGFFVDSRDVPAVRVHRALVPLQVLVVSSRIAPKRANPRTSLYRERSSRMFAAASRNERYWAFPPTRDTERPTSIAGT